MPIYDYVCSACSTRTEFIHGIDAPAPRFCPACGAEDTLRKAFVPPAVHFKGSGWAKKDRSSRTKSKAGTGAAGESAGGSAEVTSGSEAGAKPAKADASSATATSKAGGEG